VTQSIIYSGAGVTNDGPLIPSGPYHATWGSSQLTGGALNIGLLEGVVRLQQRVEGIPVRASQWGQTIIDWVIQGGGCYGLLTIKEWTTNTRRFLWPFGGFNTTTGKPSLTANPDHGLMPRPGTMLHQFCAPLTLTALPGSQAATYGPITRTYPFVSVLPTHNLEIIMGAMERNVVVAVACLPVIDEADSAIVNASGLATSQARFFNDT